MPTPVDALKNADTMRFSALTADFKISSPLGDTPGTISKHDICIKKKSGSLNFVMNMQDLGFAYDVDINFHGKVNPSDESRIIWSVNDSPDKTVKISGYDIHLDSIVGQLEATVVALSPAIKGSNCSGATREFTSHFVTATATSSLKVTGSGSVIGIDFGCSLEMTNIDATGDGGESTALNVTLEMLGNDLRNKCVVADVVGNTAKILATVSGLAVGGGLPVFAWTVNGAMTQGDTSKDEISVLLPAVPALVTVTVNVTAGIDTASAMLTFTPMTKEDALRAIMMCDFIKNLPRKLPQPFYDQGDPAYIHGDPNPGLINPADLAGLGRLSRPEMNKFIRQSVADAAAREKNVKPMAGR